MRGSSVALALMVCLLLRGSSSAQEASAKTEILSNGNIIHSLLAAPVVGQPFTATARHRSTRTLADGTTISHHGHHFFARDSEGRVRVEMRLALGDHGGPDTVRVFAIDPVAHTLTTWETGPKANSKIASVVKIPAQHNQTQTVVPSQPPPSGRFQLIVTTEDLAPETLQGIPVSVVRKTTIVPAGRAGNDAPITRTLETWTSPDLKLLMKEQWDDPRSGERIVKLDDLSRSEPDPALFRPPSGYVVKDVLQSLRELEEKLSVTQD
jgi:hypothetical protein